MEVETLFDVQEATELETQEGTDEYNQMCIDLELDHLAISPESGVNGIPRLNEREYNFYKYLLSDHTDLDNYEGIVPIRVLKAYKTCKENGWLDDVDKVEIWKAKKIDDPIMVAKFGFNDYGMIARWGEELRSFPELVQKAIENKKSDMQSDLSRMRSYIELFDKNEDKFVESVIMGNTSGIYL